MKTLTAANKFSICAALLLLISFAYNPPCSSADGVYPHHDITVTLDPDAHRLSAVDSISLPSDFPREFTFTLHAGLNPKTSTAGATLSGPRVMPGPVPLESFRVSLPPGAPGFALVYAGRIFHPLEPVGRDQARGFDQTPGSISGKGVYLAGSSAWYPVLESGFITFTLTVDVPEKWDAVSQGTRMPGAGAKTGLSVTWDSPEPQEEIYLVASRFTRYEKAGRVSAQAYLRSPDEQLAARYLDATRKYIGMYDSLIGPYPYTKFALVENFWETGFGMPSFTLLGPAVLRLPFIINTSYPHEILHNWWGNSVYPVYEKGNWSEGLTAYLADHLLKEQQGQGAEYRLNTLQKYADYVLTGRDFPLTQFTSRHSPSTEAVGYGKALMFFHMLRLRLGDERFTRAIRDFYRDYKFRFATFFDLQKSFEASSGQALGPEFDQWVGRTGAPGIKLRDAESRKQGDAYVVQVVLEQTQSGDAYRLRVPVAVTVEGSDKAVQTVIEMNRKKQLISVPVPSRPLRIDVDPEFDLFRRLDRGEIPPAVSQVLGAEKMLVILPASAGKELLAAYREFARSLAGAGSGQVDVKLDSEVAAVPGDRSVTVLGWENRLLERILPVWRSYDVSISGSSVHIGKTVLAKTGHSIVLTARNPGNRDLGLMFIAADDSAALPGLGRKLPHYHKYSYLIFEGGEPANIAKGRWPVTDSPLTRFLGGREEQIARVDRGKLAPRQALAQLPSVFSEQRMVDTVRFLSSERLKGREIGTPEIEEASAYLARMFEQAGLAPGGDSGGYVQAWKDPQRNILLQNVVGVIPGKNREPTGQSVVVGAHYDHLGLGMNIGRSQDRGKVHPGADDNASGVSVLLELARAFASWPAPDRTIVFIAFTGEEEGRLGSAHYVRHEKTRPVKNSIGMLNLDTVGRLGNGKLLVLGGGSAREWPHIFRGAGFVTGVECEMVSEDLDSSDQKSFQDAGVPAVQLFSGPNPDYHRPTDTADRIDPAGLVKAASVAREVVEYLAGRPGPLSSTLKPGGASPSAGQKTERKVFLGTIPDFGYTGNGVRLSGVEQGSPAAAAGLREGDVITGVNDSPVAGLRDFSNILRALKPGDRAMVRYLRDGKESRVAATLRPR